MVDFDELYASLPDSVKQDAHLGSNVSLERLETPSVGLNIALKGGLGSGRIPTIWGPKSAGKSLFCTQMIGIQQKKGRTTAYLDVEGTYDPVWGERLGVDNEKLIHFNTVTMNQFVDQTIALINAGVDLIFVDSVTALVPGAYTEKDSEEFKQFADTNAMGSLARDTSKALNMISGALNGKHTAVVLVSQTRNKSAGLFWKMDKTNGQALEFYSSTMIKLMSSNSDSKDWSITGEAFVGDRIVSKKIGRKVKWTIEYNKIGPQGAEGEYDLFFDGDDVGIDWVGETLDMAVDKDVVAKGGAWYTFEKMKAQGRDNAVKWLRENPDTADRMRDRVIA